MVLIASLEITGWLETPGVNILERMDMFEYLGNLKIIENLQYFFLDLDHLTTSPPNVL